MPLTNKYLINKDELVNLNRDLIKNSNMVNFSERINQRGLGE